MPSHDSFDPYLKWLGIRTQEHPPNHYRLLGIDLFEADADVVSNAADARMAHVRTYQTGKYSALSQKVLNEIASAKVCLLNAEKKAAYDAQLQIELMAVPPAMPAPVAGGPPPLPTRPGTNGNGAAASAASVPPLRDWRLWIAVAAALLLLVAIGTAALLVRGRGTQVAAGSEETSTEEGAASAKAGPPDETGDFAARPQVVTSEKPKPAESNPAAPPSPAEKPKPASPNGEVRPDSTAKPGGEDGTGPATKPDGEAKPAPATKPDGEEKPEPSTKPGGEMKPEPTAKPDAAEKPDPEAKPAPAVEAIVRQPAPSEEDRQRAEATVRELFRAELASAKTPAERLALSDKLFQQALATKDNPAACYVLLRAAADLANAAGELPRTIEILGEVGRRFEVDAVGMKADVLEKAVAGLRTAANPLVLAHDVADNALATVEEAIAEDQFDTAARVDKVAMAAARRAGDSDLVRDAANLGRLAQQLHKQFETVRQAQQELASSPDDPAANYTVGRWHCFIKGRWDKGLPYLAKCQEGDLPSLAKLDLGGPEEANLQVILADRWVKYAEREDDDAKRQVQLRAAHWLRKALPGLTGLDKVSAEKQIEKLSKVAPLLQPRERGVSVPGDVALASAGTKITGPQANAAYLIDGDLSGDPAVADGTCPCQWTVTFPKLYSLREIRLLLHDRGRNKRYYWYAIATSADGENFKPLVDRGKGTGNWFGWQVIQFPPRPVKAIRLFGLNESGDRVFYAVELEAYCVSPKVPPGNPPQPPPPDPATASKLPEEKPVPGEKPSEVPAEKPAEKPPPEPAPQPPVGPKPPAKRSPAKRVAN